MITPLNFAAILTWEEARTLVLFIQKTLNVRRAFIKEDIKKLQDHNLLEIYNSLSSFINFMEEKDD